MSKQMSKQIGKSNSFIKPFLKWVGGKTQIIDNIMDNFPKEMNNYHELFLGGGSVLFALLSLERENKLKINGKVYAYDLNGSLINVYKHIQNNKDELLDYIERYRDEYNSIKGELVNRKSKTREEGLTSQESYYYWIRHKYNTIDKTSIEYSALFMFLNKTNYRGVYREGPNGFNVPFGHYKKTPKIITKKDLDIISDLIKDVEFRQCDFSESMKNIREGDFVYLDPPYAPIKDDSFVGYTKDGFGLENHNKLFREVRSLNEKKVKFVMSNAKVELVTDNFKDYQIDDIEARRAIHCKEPGSKTMEVIIHN